MCSDYWLQLFTITLQTRYFGVISFADLFYTDDPPVLVLFTPAFRFLFGQLGAPGAPAGAAEHGSPVHGPGDSVSAPSQRLTSCIARVQPPLQLLRVNVFFLINFIILF